MWKTKIKIIYRSIKAHPVIWCLVLLAGYFVADFVGRGLVESGAGPMAVIMDWWRAVEWLFDHPIGELVLLTSAGWLVWSALSKTVEKEAAERKSLSAAESQSRDKTANQFEVQINKVLDARLSKYDLQLNALFAYVKAEKYIKEADETLKDIDQALQKCEQFKQSWYVERYAEFDWQAARADLSDATHKTLAHHLDQLDELISGVVPRSKQQEVRLAMEAEGFVAPKEDGPPCSEIPDIRPRHNMLRFQKERIARQRMLARANLNDHAHWLFREN